LHQVGDLFELNVKLRCQKVNAPFLTGTQSHFTKVLEFIVIVFRMEWA